jgi:hypothetical protein
MPRATVKPNTLYEDFVGFRGARRNAYFFLGVFGSLYIVKFILAVNFSMYSNVSPLTRETTDLRYQEQMNSQREMAEALLAQEVLRHPPKQPPIA